MEIHIYCYIQDEKMNVLVVLDCIKCVSNVIFTLIYCRVNVRNAIFTQYSVNTTVNTAFITFSLQ